MGWLLFREIGDLVDGDKWGWSTLGDRERLISVVLPDTCSLTSILGLGDHSVCWVTRQNKTTRRWFWCFLVWRIQWTANDPKQALKEDQILRNSLSAGVDRRS